LEQILQLCSDELRQEDSGTLGTLTVRRLPLTLSPFHHFTVSPLIITIFAEINDMTMPRTKRSLDIILLKVLVAATFAVGILCRCANTVTLQGGPKDTLPPKVMNIKPAWGTVNFGDKRIYIEFDEYVKLKDQQKEFLTSPLMGKPPLLTIRGRGIQIDIKDTLVPNTTYAFDFGGAIQDNNEGNVLDGFRYVFSTGPEIDSMLMSGYCVDAYTKDSIPGAMIFFYEAAKDTVPTGQDSVLLKRRPDAVAKGKGNGIFIAQNLKPVPYRVYAFDDKNNNQIYDPGDEKVAFLDSLFNPATLGEFTIHYDTSRKYFVADPQCYFRLFTDKKFQRQLLSKKDRPAQSKVDLIFGAPYPQISSLTLDGIDSTAFIRDYSSQRDTLTLWLAVPPADLPDTVKGSITYLKHDSLNVLQPVTEKLALFWKAFEGKKKKEDKDEKPVNPFKVTVEASTSLNPEKNLPMVFEYPLKSMDSTAISLIRLADGKKYRVKYSVAQDTANLRRWTIKAPWSADQKYQLEIPSGVFENIRGEANDTLKADFTVISPDKYATIVINVTGKTPESEYVLQILGQGNRVLQERAHARTGKYTFLYLDPGTVRIRVVEDVNANGKWDDGNLITQEQPERVEIYAPEAGKEDIPTKANWEVEYNIDMAALFVPVKIEDIVAQLRTNEQMRITRMLKALQDRKLHPTKQQPTGGNSSLMGGAQMPSGLPLPGLNQ